MNPAEQHNTVTLSQSSKANQLIQRNERSLFLFENLKG
jgi:hypothetical protein